MLSLVPSLGATTVSLYGRHFWRDWARATAWVAAGGGILFASGDIVDLGSAAAEGEDIAREMAKIAWEVLEHLCELATMILGLGFGIALRSWVGHDQDRNVQLVGHRLRSILLPSILTMVALQVAADQLLLSPHNVAQLKSSYTDSGGGWVAAIKDSPSAVPRYWKWCEVRPGEEPAAIQLGAELDWDGLPERVRVPLAERRTSWLVRIVRPLLTLAIAAAVMASRRRGKRVALPSMLIIPILAQAAFNLSLGSLRPLLASASGGFAELGALSLCVALLFAVDRVVLRLSASRAALPSADSVTAVRDQPLPSQHGVERWIPGLMLLVGVSMLPWLAARWLPMEAERHLRPSVGRDSRIVLREARMELRPREEAGGVQLESPLIQTATLGNEKWFSIERGLVAESALLSAADGARYRVGRLSLEPHEGRLRWRGYVDSVAEDGETTRLLEGRGWLRILDGSLVWEAP